MQFILVNSDIHISACCNFNKCTGSTHQKDFVCITCLLSLTISEFGIPSNRINSCFSNTHQHHPTNPSKGFKSYSLNRQKHRQTDRHTDRQKHRQTHRQTDMTKNITYPHTQVVKRGRSTMRPLNIRLPTVLTSR